MTKIKDLEIMKLRTEIAIRKTKRGHALKNGNIKLVALIDQDVKSLNNELVYRRSL